MAPKKRKGKAGRRAGARPDDVMTDRREKRRLKKLAKKKKKAKRGRKSRLRDLKNIPLGGGDGALDVPVMRYSTSDGAGKVEDASPLPDCGADGTGDELLHGHLDINPENVKRSAYVIDVTCGDNEAILFMKGLSTGSKGACVLFEQNWLTPNEFQYVSGRESAKDWKRSIKHHGKSLKILVSRGLMCLKQRRCKCYTCEGRVKDDDGRISPDRADKQLSGSSSHGQDLSKSATSECQDTAESARTGSVDVTENKSQPNEDAQSPKCYVTTADLCTSQADDIHAPPQNNTLQADPDLHAKVKSHALIEEHSGFGYKYQIASSTKSHLSDILGKCDGESSSHNEGPDTSSPAILNALQQSGSLTACHSRDSSGHEVVSPLMISRSFESSACHVSDESGESATDESGSHSSTSLATYGSLSPSDCSKSRKRARIGKQERKVPKRSNEMCQGHVVPEKAMKLEYNYPEDDAGYRDSSASTNDSSDVSSENNDVKSPERAQSMLISCDSDISVKDELRQTNCVIPDDQSANDLKAVDLEIKYTPANDLQTLDSADIASLGTKLDDRLPGGDVTHRSDSGRDNLIQNDDKLELCSLLDRQQSDKPSVFESQSGDGSRFGNTNSVLNDLPKYGDGQLERFSDSSNPEHSPPPSDTTQPTSKPSDSLPTSSADDSDGTTSRAPPKGNSVKKACRLLSIIDGLKSAPKDAKPVSPTMFATSVSTENSQVVHKSRKDTVPMQYNSSSKQYHVKENSPAGEDEVPGSSKHTTASTTVTSNIHVPASCSRPIGAGKDVGTSLVHGAGTVRAPTVSKQIDPLLFRPPIPIPMMTPFPVLPFGMSIPPTLYASMIQNGVPLEWQLALMNNQLGPNELVLLTSAMVHQSSLVQNKPTKSEVPSSASLSSTSADGATATKAVPTSGSSGYSSGKQKSSHQAPFANGKAASPYRHGRHGNNAKQDHIRALRAGTQSSSIHPAFGGIGQAPARGSYREALSQRAMASVQKSGADPKSGSTLSWEDLRGGSDLLTTGSAGLQPARGADALDLTNATRTRGTGSPKHGVTIPFWISHSFRTHPANL